LYEIRYRPAAERQLQSLPRQIARRIAIAIDRLADNPRPVGARKFVGGDDIYRIRISKYRVVYEVRDNELLVLVIRVAKRDEVYRNL
jgi:mRNA interferase RelE/StbE